MEKPLKRGRLLREILKQERLAPLPIEFQLAWLIAFNNGLFDDLDPDQLGRVLDSLERAVADSGLGLDDTRDTWSKALSGWLRVHQELHT
jgi:F-type H+-transporting ATPase subunit alpha